MGIRHFMFFHAEDYHAHRDLLPLRCRVCGAVIKEGEPFERSSSGARYNVKFFCKHHKQNPDDSDDPEVVVYQPTRKNRLDRHN